MKKIFTFAIALVCALAVNAETTIKLSANADGTGDVVLTAGQSTFVYVYMTTTEDSLAGYQGLLVCPTGVKLAWGPNEDVEEDYWQVYKGSIGAKAMSAQASQKEGGYQLLLSSTSNKLFKAKSGDILKLQLSADNSYVAGSEIKLTQQVAARTNGTKVEPDDYSTDIEVISEIQPNNSNAPIYNLQGVRVNKAENGIFIQNGKKFVVK